MKPSEKIITRIGELAMKRMGNDFGYYPVPTEIYIQAILDYLDEEEKR